jgi:hypothetical protein
MARLENPIDLTDAELDMIAAGQQEGLVNVNVEDVNVNVNANVLTRRTTNNNNNN